MLARVLLGVLTRVVQVLFAAGTADYVVEVEAKSGSSDEADAVGAFDGTVATGTNLACQARLEVLILKPAGRTFRARVSRLFRECSFVAHVARRLALGARPPCRAGNARVLSVVECSGGTGARRVADTVYVAIDSGPSLGDGDGRGPAGSDGTGLGFATGCVSLVPLEPSAWAADTRGD